MTTDNHSQEPSDRAREILRALIEHYVRDGQPVGSRTLSRSTGLQLSAASIRNVMSDLEELGFIAAPHTSAGRVPTAKGYRFFVDTLVKLQPPRGRELQQLQAQLADDQAHDGKQVAATASEALSSLTSLAGVVTVPRPRQVQLRQVEFLPLSDQRVLAILVINDAEVQNRILHMERDYGADELRRARTAYPLLRDENLELVFRELDRIRRRRYGLPGAGTTTGAGEEEEKGETR